jgi:hypothetical protein
MLVMKDKKNWDDREESTLKKSGHCKYGGWSRDGTSRFNELYNLVAEDRSCPQAEAMETELLAFCRKEMGVGGPQEGGGKEVVLLLWWWNRRL